MSFSPPNYTDGVPVKISERFKPPPEIQLPSKLLNALSRTQVPVAFHDDYNFDLERKILSKTTEWINWRSNEKTERQQRIYGRELERQKQLENEQKEKLNQVSYPSADELTSSADEDDEIDDEAINNIPLKTASDVAETNPFNSILMPTQATSCITTSNRKSHRRYASNSSNKIDFSFFESDASPFDHLEMKSLNEMEVLAQVLKSTAIESDEATTLERNNSSESENSETRGGGGNNNNNDQQMLSDSVISKPQDIPHEQLSYQHNFNPQQVYSNYYNYTGASMPNSNNSQYFNANSATHQHASSSLYPFSQNAYYTQNYAVNFIGGNNNNLATTTTTVTTTCERLINNDKMEVSNISKSVPDMVKELNEELDNSQRRRIRNYSQNSHKEEIINTDGVSEESESLPRGVIE